MVVIFSFVVYYIFFVKHLKLETYTSAHVYFSLSDEYCSMRQKTQAQIALQSDNVARDDRFGFLLLEFLVARNLALCVIIYISLDF